MFGLNFLADDHLPKHNAFFGDLLFATGRRDFDSTPGVDTQNGWIVSMEPGAEFRYVFGNVQSKLWPDPQRDFHFFWRGTASHDLEVTIVQNGPTGNPEWRGMVPVNNPPTVTIEPHRAQYIIIKNKAALPWTGRFEFGFAEGPEFTSKAFRDWCKRHQITGARFMDLQRAKYAEQSHLVTNTPHATMHGDWRGDFQGITVSQALLMATECEFDHAWVCVPPGMQATTLIAALDHFSGVPFVTLENGGNEIWNRGASQKAGHYYLARAHATFGTFAGIPGGTLDLTQPGWVLADDKIAYTPAGQMWPDKLKAMRPEPILTSNEAAYAMAMVDAAAILEAMTEAWDFDATERCFINRHGVRIYNTMGGQNGDARFVQNIVKVFAATMPEYNWRIVQDHFTGFSFAPYLAYQYVTAALPDHLKAPGEPTDAEFWAAAEAGWQRALNLYRGNVAAQPTGWRHAVYESQLSFVDFRDGRAGDWWTAKRNSVHAEAMLLKMAEDLAAEGPWAAMIYGQGITSDEFKPGQAYGQGWWSVLPAWDTVSTLYAELGAKFAPPPVVGPPVTGPPDPEPVDPPAPIDEREQIALDLEALAVRVREL